MSSEAAQRIVPVIVGPTASGKTAIAIELALLLDGEIISADSRQIYRHLTIGTAKPSPDQLARVPHHFIDILEPGAEFNAGAFGEQGRRVIDEVFARGKTPIVAGGSGLYIQALADGFFEGPSADQEYRRLLSGRMREKGVADLLDELRRVDPVSAAKIEPTRPHRIIRALEVFHLTGRPISELHTQGRVQANFRAVMFGLRWERRALYDRINARCDAMLQDGLLDEVESVLGRRVRPDAPGLNSVGYAEALTFKRGEIEPGEMVRLFKQNSRRYAKRQLTWFRRDGRITWIEMDEKTDANGVAAWIAEQTPR